MPLWVPGTALAVESPLTIESVAGVSTIKARTVPHAAAVITGATVANTNPETTVLAETFDIGGGIVADDDIFRISAWGVYTNNSAGVATIQFRFKAGTVALGSILTANIAQQATARAWALVGTYRVISSAAAVNGSMRLSIADGTTAADVYDRTQRTAAAAVDFSAGQSFDLTADHSVADPNVSVTCDAAVFEWFRAS